MQDMIPPQDRSIRNIPINTNRQPPREYSDLERQIRPPHRSGRRAIFIWGIIIVAICAALGVLLSTVFQNTTIVLYPHTQSITQNVSLTLEPVQNAGSTAYQTLSLTRSATTTVTASGTQYVSTAASGVITIYNTYSTKAVKLVTSTRFQAPNGNIYRIHSSVTVPGETAGIDGATQSGSVSALVYADKPGAAYNLTNPTTFTIPGFKGQPEYTGFSAQSQESISGGFTGNEPAVSKSDMANAESLLQQSLNSALGGAVTGGIPTGFILIPGSAQTTYTDIAQGSANASSSVVTLSQNATESAAIVRQTDLASAVARQVVATYNGEPVDFVSPPAVALASSTTPNITGPLTITVIAPLTLIWQINQQAVKQALLGKPKSSFESIIQAFQPSVDQAEAKVRPFWSSTFPTDPNKISITLSQPQGQ